MIRCLKISDLQGYLQDPPAGVLRQNIERHLPACGRCRDRFNGLAATSACVDDWLSALASPLDQAPVDLAAGFARVLDRAAEPRFAIDSAIAWYVSLARGVHDLVRPPKLPPLDITSRPVHVKDIWGLYPKDPWSRFCSAGIHVGVLTLLLFGFANPAIQRSIRQNLTPMDPNVKPYVPDARPKANMLQGGGGGGAREPLPVSKGRLPKVAMKQFVPPQIVDRTPLLAMTPTIVAPPDTPLPLSNLNNWGDPLAKLMNNSNGNGSGGGMGNGTGGGLGSGHGVGFGPGEGGGIGGGVFRAGGGVSAPMVLVKVDPEYSEEARKAKYSGTVLLSVIVDTEGRARDIRVMRSLGMGLDEKAMDAVQKWRFRPGMSNGRPVNVRAQIEVNFRLL